MKLCIIAEAKAVIRNAAIAVGDLIQYLQDLGQDSDEWVAMNEFLKAPDARGWEKVKWVVDSAMQQATTSKEPELTQRMKKWAILTNLSSPVAAAAVYDIEPQTAKGTPLQSLTQSKSIRDKYKLALGPAGYVATMSNVGKISPNKLKDMLKTMAASGPAIAKAAKKDIPGVKPMPRF